RRTGPRPRLTESRTACECVAARAAVGPGHPSYSVVPPGVEGASAQERSSLVIASANNPAVVVVTLGLAMSASPFGILGVVVLLGSRRPLANAWAFTIGWATSITVFGLVTYRLAAQSSTSTSTSTSTSASAAAATISQAALGFALGAVLLVLGLRLWLTRHRQGKSSSEPKWMTQAERISPVFAFGLGLFLPTWGMIVPAVGQIAVA